MRIKKFNVISKNINEGKTNHLDDLYVVVNGSTEIKKIEHEVKGQRLKG